MKLTFSLNSTKSGKDDDVVCVTKHTYAFL